ncbi:unnamed protein product [Hapterophycus canaliculatus]
MGMLLCPILIQFGSGVKQLREGCCWVESLDRKSGESRAAAIVFLVQNTRNTAPVFLLRFAEYGVAMKAVSRLWTWVMGHVKRASYVWRKLIFRRGPFHTCEMHRARPG